MRRIIFGWLMLMLLNGVAAGQTSITLHVSANAKSLGNGTARLPFADIQQGVNEAEQQASLRKNTHFIIQLSAGVFRLGKPISVKFSGINGNRLSLQGMGTDATIVSGGREVPVQWKPWRSGIFVAKIPKRLPQFHKCWLGGKSYQLATTEVGAGVARPMAEGILLPTPMLKLPADQMRLVQAVKWIHHRLPLAKPVKVANAWKLPFDQPAFNVLWKGLERALQINVSQSFTLENSLDFLDESGEFFVDQTSQNIYCKPLPSHAALPTKMVVPVQEQLILLEGRAGAPVANIEVAQLRLMHTHWPGADDVGLRPVQANIYATLDHHLGGHMSGAISINHADGIRFNQLTFSQLDNVAIRAAEGVSNLFITNSLFDTLGAGAIDVGFPAHDADDLPGEAHATNINISQNRFFHCAQRYGSSPVVTLYYPENALIANNHIAFAGYTGISVGWGWQKPNSTMRNNLIRNNLIEQVNQLAMDGAGIYTLGHQPGSVCEGNVVMGLQGAPKGSAGLYHDEGSAGWRTHNNFSLVERPDQLALNLNGSKALQVEGLYSNSGNVYYLPDHLKSGEMPITISTFMLLKASDASVLRSAIASTGHRPFTPVEPLLAPLTANAEPVVVGTFPLQVEAEFYNSISAPLANNYSWVSDNSTPVDFDGACVMSAMLSPLKNLPAQSPRPKLGYRLDVQKTGRYQLAVKGGGPIANGANYLHGWLNGTWFSQPFNDYKGIGPFAANQLQWLPVGQPILLTKGSHLLEWSMSSHGFQLDAWRIEMVDTKLPLQKWKPVLRRNAQLKRRN